MRDRPPHPHQALEGALDEMIAGLGEDLDGDVLGDEIVFDEHAHEVEVGLRGRGETDLDLLESHSHQDLEHAQLALAIHRVDERLVSVPQIDAAPCRSAGDGTGGPLAIGQVDG